MSCLDECSCFVTRTQSFVNAINGMGSTLPLAGRRESKGSKRGSIIQLEGGRRGRGPVLDSTLTVVQPSKEGYLYLNNYAIVSSGEELVGLAPE